MKLGNSLFKSEGKYLDGLIWIFFIVAMISELYLVYVNYLARVRYKKYFTEMNPTWKWFDKRGLTHVSLVLGFIISFLIAIFFGPVLLAHSLIGFLAGAIATNAVFDRITFGRRYLCIKLRCKRLEEVRKCTTCEFQNQYDVDVFSLKVRKKGVETPFKQRYVHLIGFLKWIRDKVWRW